MFHKLDKLSVLQGTVSLACLQSLGLYCVHLFEDTTQSHMGIEELLRRCDEDALRRGTGQDLARRGMFHRDVAGEERLGVDGLEVAVRAAELFSGLGVQPLVMFLQVHCKTTKRIGSQHGH